MVISLYMIWNYSKQVSNIGFITVHGLNEGHIAPYTDIEFRLTKYQTYIIMKFWYKSLQLIIEETITLLTRIKYTGCIIKRQNKNTTLQYT